MWKSGHINISTGLNVHYKQWSTEAASPTTSCEERDSIMQKMSEYKAIAMKIVEDRINNQDSLSLKDVKQEVVAIFNRPIINKPIKPSVVQAFDQFINTLKTERKPSTIQSFNTMMNKHLKPFCEEKNRALSWSLFDVDFGAQWKQYFIAHKIQDTTAGKNFRRLHTFLKWASVKNILGTNYFRDWGRIKEKSNVPIVCSENDLINLRKYVDDPEKRNDLRMIADMFLFLCNTGLRIGDFLNLRYRNLHHEKTGKGTVTERYLLKINSEKTEIPLTIPLTQEALDLIFQYNPKLRGSITPYQYRRESKKDLGWGLVFDVNPVIQENPNHPLFPKVFQQDINEKIKIIGEDCGIYSSYERIERYGAKKEKVYKPKYALLTCHTARRTFITIALQSGIPVPVIMKYTGHTSYKSIARYFSISEEYMFKQMGKFGVKNSQQTFSQMEQNFRSSFY